MTEAIAALLGAVIGSILTFILGFIAANRQEQRKMKMSVLVNLLSGRMRILSKDVADYTNVIPVIFAKDEKVRRSYQNFCFSLGGTNAEEKIKRYNEMVIEISKSLGFSDNLTEADLQYGFYFPDPAFQPPSAASNADANRST